MNVYTIFFKATFNRLTDFTLFVRDNRLPCFNNCYFYT